jgi:iron complex outermembrane receptor protein
VSLLVGAPSFAQTASDSANKTAKDEEPVLQEVVITAERRNTSMQTTAISATVVSGDTLEKKGVMGLTAVQQIAPGVIIADYGSANTLNIRGIGQARVDVDLPSGVAIYRDGVPTLSGYFQNAPYYDMASLEVLRGPQGTFGGKSASAGALFLHTRDPELGKFSTDFMLGTGNKSFIETTDVFNFPVGETLAIRAAFHGEWRNTLYDSITSNNAPGGTDANGPFFGHDNRKIYSGRFGVKWQPNANFDAVLKVDLDKLYFGMHIATGFDAATGDVEDIRNPIVNGGHFYEDWGYRSSLNMHYKLDNGVDFGSLTGYSYVNTTANWDINGSDPRPLNLVSHGWFTNVSQEFNIVSPTDGKWNWLVGFFAQRYDNVALGPDKLGFAFETNDSRRPEYATPWHKNEKTFAAFAQIGYKFTPELELQVSGRQGHYYFDQYTRFVIDFSGFFGGPDAPYVYLEGPEGHIESYSETKTDWKVALNYEPSKTQFFYGTIGRGHSPGSINLSSPTFFAVPDHGSYKPMIVTNYEAGWKQSSLEQRLQTQVAVYYQEFKNYQADFALASGPGVPSNLTLFQLQNALTKSTIYGAEFGAQGAFGNFTMDFGAAYIHSKLGSFGEIVNTFAGVPGYDPRPAVDLKGSKTPFSPPITASTGLSYKFNMGNDWALTPRVDISYRNDAYSRLWRNHATKLPGYTMVNAQINYGNDTKYVQLWATNLFDKKYISAKQNVDGAPADAQYPFPHIVGIVYAGLPRLFGIRAGMSF